MSTRVAWQVKHKVCGNLNQQTHANYDRAEVCSQYLRQCQQEVQWVVIEIRALTSTTVLQETYLGRDYIWCTSKEHITVFGQHLLIRRYFATFYCCLLASKYLIRIIWIVLWGATQVKVLRLWIHPKNLKTDQNQPTHQTKKKRTVSMKSHTQRIMKLRQKTDNVLICWLPSSSSNGKIHKCRFWHVRKLFPIISYYDAA